LNNSQVLQGNNSKIRRGLVLEGGGAKGAWQFGVLKALDEAGIKFDYVAGSSVGALNGALWAAGRLDLGDELWNSLSLSKVYKLRLHHSPMFVIGLFARFFYAYVKGFISAVKAPLSLRISLYGLMSTPTFVAAIYLLFVITRFFSGAATNTELWRLLIIGVVFMALPLGGLVVYRMEMGRKQFFFYTSLFSLVGLILNLLPFDDRDRNINITDQSSLRDVLGNAVFSTLLEMPILLWVLGVVPFVIFCIAKFSRYLNTSIFSVAPLEVIINDLLVGKFKIPLFATVAREIGKYFDPDNPQYRYDSGTGYSAATPHSTIIPTYLRVDRLHQDDALTTLLATSALPLGITPRRKGEHAVSAQESSAVREAEAEEFSKLLLSRTFGKGSHKSKVFLIDGGVVDNIPWHPFIEDEPCNQIVIVCCNPVEKKDSFKSEMRKEWKDRNRLLRIVKASLQFDDTKHNTIRDEEGDPACLNTYIVDENGVATRKEQQVTDFGPFKYGNFVGIKNKPPRIFRYRGGPARWPEVVIIAPDAKLGNFLTGTLNFSPDVARERQKAGRQEASRFIEEIKSFTMS
jgi:predicted acylesterase/phospholipase RssA